MVDIIITDDLVVVSLPSNIFAIELLITLIAKETIEGLDNGVEVQPFGDGVDAVLAFGRSVVVVGALEDEAHALRHESNIAGFTPAEKVESDLTETVVLAHVVHRIAPTVKGAIEGLGLCVPALDTAKALQARVVRLTNGVI